MTDYYESVKVTTLEAQKQLNKFRNEVGVCEAAKFLKNFHLRPRSDRVTIVSTLDDYPMRGYICSKTKVCKELLALYGHRDDMENFNTRKSKPRDEAEELFQAKLISNIDNPHFLHALEMEGLQFVTSEFILAPKGEARNRVDVLALGRRASGENVLFLLELKAEDCKDKDGAETQAERYLQHYFGSERQEVTRAILATYPNCSVNTPTAVEAWVVVGSASTFPNVMCRKVRSL